MSPKLRAPLSSLLDDPIAHDRLERVRRRIATTRRLPPNERAWRWAPAMALVLVVAAIAAVWRWTAPGELREPDALASGATFELARGGRV
ncbi:MAG: hypothetical protein IT378_17665, partial [Sandaracinaceae bacterium]|nr:hypothetical protein [Sandaracinaceae bacterium]